MAERFFGQDFWDNGALIHQAQRNIFPLQPQLISLPYFNVTGADASQIQAFICFCLSHMRVYAMLADSWVGFPDIAMYSR